jgi:hypothetical protein
VGSNVVVMQPMVVDLPAPFAPKKAKRLEAATSNDKS